MKIVWHHPSPTLGWRQDNGNRSNQDSKFDFLATRQCLVKIDQGQQKIKIVRSNQQSNLRSSCQSIFSLSWHHPSPTQCQCLNQSANEGNSGGGRDRTCHLYAHKKTVVHKNSLSYSKWLNLVGKLQQHALYAFYFGTSDLCCVHPEGRGYVEESCQCTTILT